MTNATVLKVLGVIGAVSILGGWIGSRVANKGYERRVKSYDSEMHDLRDTLTNDIDRMRKDADRDIKSRVEQFLNQALDEEAKREVRSHISDKIGVLDLNSIVKDFAKSCMQTSADNVASDLKETYDDSLNDLFSELKDEAKDQIRDYIDDMAESKLESWLDKELYHVNSRRVIEDSVDRAVKDEVSSVVRDKLKWLNVNNFKAFLV